MKEKVKLLTMHGKKLQVTFDLQSKSPFNSQEYFSIVNTHTHARLSFHSLSLTITVIVRCHFSNQNRYPTSLLYQKSPVHALSRKNMYTIIGIVYVIDVWSQEYVIISIFPEVYPGEANTNLIQTPPPAPTPPPPTKTSPAGPKTTSRSS